MKQNKTNEPWWRGLLTLFLATAYMLVSFYWVEPALGRMAAGRVISRILSAALLLGWLALAYLAGRWGTRQLLRAQIICGAYPFVGLLVMEFLETSAFQSFDILYFVAISPWQGVMGMIPRMPNWASWLFCLAIPALQGLLYLLGRRGSSAGRLLSYQPSSLQPPEQKKSASDPEGPLSREE
ncbi:MAG: hypothetical protein PHD67_04610 [Oscillospiraceae bacterium]|nr:hypothetical protein [Oscillospiraceae bacterium]